MKKSSLTFPLTVFVAAALSCQAQLTNFHRLHSFGFANQSGIVPKAGLTIASDGHLYGTTSGDEFQRYGTIFKVQRGGAGYQVLHHFEGGTNNNGAVAVAELLEGSDGALYGTTAGGGRGGGTVFKINTDGTGFRVLHSFRESSRDDGFNPRAPVIEGSDGKLYGTTVNGYPGGGEGTIFRLNKDGSGYEKLRHFNISGVDGLYPHSPLVEAQDGALYGTAAEGGSADLAAVYGAVYKLNKDGSGFSVVRSFLRHSTEPEVIQSGLIEGKDGALYGMSVNGGAMNYGTVFKIQKDGQQLELLHSFGNSDGGLPFDDLIEGHDGLLYGATPVGGEKGSGTVFKINKDGSGFTILHHFGGDIDGLFPGCKLVQASSGELFGTTQRGGSDQDGTIFALDTNGLNYRIVWQFSPGGRDTRRPQSALVEGPDGALYGAGYVAGSIYLDRGGGVFKVNKDGTGYAVVRLFGLTGEPSRLAGGIILGSDGRLYGTSEAGGNQNGGTVYGLNRDGTDFQVLHHFAGADGGFPSAGLVEAGDGFLYGVTREPLAGMIFKVAKSGAGYQIIKALDRLLDGASPQAALIEGSDGFLYGATPIGGSFDRGTIFRTSKDGLSFTVVRHMQTNAADPRGILGRLLEGTDQALYGTTHAGGNDNRGTVFKINKDGTAYAVLHHFMVAEKVSSPMASLVEGRDGALYGTAQYDDTNYAGAVFKLEKDGSGFMLVHEFTRTDGMHSRTPLLSARDGALYGATQRGGDLGFGTVFRIGHFIGLRKDSDVARLELAGVPGYVYQLQRSTDLEAWSLLQFVTMPASGRLQLDDAASPAGSAFYCVRP
jgi:uncharacterized repeat protein (TIGR03803 family)